MSESYVSQGLQKIFQKRSAFAVIGLTGRTGSGCTTTASLLSKSFAEIKLPNAKTDPATAEDRKYRICREYAEKNWSSFFVISVSTVIFSFLLDLDEEQLQQFLTKSKAIKPEEKITSFIDQWREPSTIWKTLRVTLRETNPEKDQLERFFKLWNDEVFQLFKNVRNSLGPSSTKLLQLVGDNLRKSGDPTSDKPNPDTFYTLPERVADIIISYRKLQSTLNKPAYIVLDALRNPFEALFFRERFPSFYLIAITTENSDRERRLAHQGFSSSEIQEYDQKEYPEKNKILSGYDAFTSQNIQSCIEKADIHIRNNGQCAPQQEPNLSELSAQIIRYFTLIIHPGLVTPTSTERCMQIAFSAKLNSGCISRQVGAAITDENNSIKAVGWNDVPAGQTPCLLRRATDLTAKQDESAFSDYEFNEIEFRKQIDGNYKRFALVDMGGRSSAYCFKDEYNTLKKKDNQVHTRSLHAEENAFLQLAKYGGDGIKGGNLYTTASPCELCAKKAFQLGIKRIIYVDPYPGISMSHILKSGNPENRPTVELFQGAIGEAYHRLYSPIISYKDEISALLKGGQISHGNPAQDAKPENLI